MKRLVDRVVDLSELIMEAFCQAFNKGKLWRFFLICFLGEHKIPPERSNYFPLLCSAAVVLNKGRLRCGITIE